jgi:hypothetical protein
MHFEREFFGFLYFFWFFLVSLFLSFISFVSFRVASLRTLLRRAGVFCVFWFSQNDTSTRYVRGKLMVQILLNACA